MPDLSSAQALQFFEICQRASQRVRMHDEDDRHDFALIVFERFFSEERGDVSREGMWAYAQASISGLVKSKFKRESRLLRESDCFGDDGTSYFEVFLPHVGARQEDAVDAHFWSERIEELSDHHRDTMEVLADGGTPLDLCYANSMRPMEAINAAAHARRQVWENGAKRQLHKARWPNGPECPDCQSRAIENIRGFRPYACRDCGASFHVLNGSPLSKFVNPWGGEDASGRLKRPFTAVCRSIELIRDGGGPSELQEALETPYLIAFELYEAVRETPWAAPLAGIAYVAPVARKRELAAKQKMPPVRAERVVRESLPEIDVNRVGAWDEEELDILANRWNAGSTAHAIARELGRSRNSVLGKIHRLGLLRIERAA